MESLEKLRMFAQSFIKLHYMFTHVQYKPIYLIMLLCKNCLETLVLSICPVCLLAVIHSLPLPKPCRQDCNNFQ